MHTDEILADDAADACCTSCWKRPVRTLLLRLSDMSGRDDGLGLGPGFDANGAMHSLVGSAILVLL